MRRIPRRVDVAKEQRVMASGVCECGCGLKTTIPRVTDRSRGWVRGVPIRFVNGHSARMVAPKSYPVRNGDRIHRNICRQILGKPIPPKVVVHHVDDDPTNYANDNLVILQSQYEHMNLHRRRAALRAGGHPFNDVLCTTCHKAVPRTACVGNARQLRICRKCNRAAVRRRKEARS